ITSGDSHTYDFLLSSKLAFFVEQKQASLGPTRRWLLILLDSQMKISSQALNMPHSWLYLLRKNTNAGFQYTKNQQERVIVSKGKPLLQQQNDPGTSECSSDGLEMCPSNWDVIKVKNDAILSSVRLHS
ncbi:hypothetical protein KIN20_018720, partial [Parelaphostrongylus tenuis]